MLFRKLHLPAALVAALALLLLATGSASAQERPLVASLLGGAGGDPDGSGYIWLELNQGRSEICYELAVRGTGPVSSLRIFEMESGRSVATLLYGVGTTSDCVRVDRQVVRQVRQNPTDYGIMVGTSQYPKGALSGALTTPSAATPSSRNPADDAADDAAAATAEPAERAQLSEPAEVPAPPGVEDALEGGDDEGEDEAKSDEEDPAQKADDQENEESETATPAPGGDDTDSAPADATPDADDESTPSARG